MRILFLSNTIRRDGAPLRLKEILEYLKQEIPNVRIDVIADRMRTSDNIYKNCSDYLFLTNDFHHQIPLYQRVVSKVLKIDIVQNKIINIIKSSKYDIFYANSIATLQTALTYKKYSPTTKVVLHLRELEAVSLLENKNLYSDILQVDKIIAISHSVYNFAVNTCKVPKEKVLLAYSGTHLDKIFSVEADKSNDFIVGGVGGMSWRKGIDFFLILAKKTIVKNPNILFEWIGVSQRDKIILDHDLIKMGIENNVKFIIENEDVISRMKKWSVFVSVAREEPLGVACIEAGALGLPILAFKNSGGPEEILSQGGGLISDYLDVDQMSDDIIKLMSDKILYGQYSKEIKLATKKYDIINSLIKIKNTLYEISNKS